KLLEREQLRVEWINEGIHRLFEVSQLHVLIAFGEHGAFFRPREDGLYVAAGQRPAAKVFTDERLDFIGERNLFDLGDDREKLQHIIRALRRKQRHAQAEAALALHVNGEQ